MAEVAVTFPSPSRFLENTPQKAAAPSAEKLTIKATIPKKSAAPKRRHIKCTKVHDKAKAGLRPKQTKSRDGMNSNLTGATVLMNTQDARLAK